MSFNRYSNDQIILAIILLLSGFGLVVMYSASSIFAMNNYDSYLHFLVQQIKWFAVGIFIMFSISQLNYKHLKQFAYLLMILSWIILILGYFFKGPNPASRWLVIGGRSWMTTSDLARVSLIIFTAFFLEKNKRQISDWRFLALYFTPFITITLALILFQPDTSTAMVIALIIFVMLFISGASWQYLSGLGVTGILLLGLKILHTPHALARIINFDDDQKQQSLNAMGSGGIFGSGLGDSMIKNGHLPQSHTDFILPIIGEELGFIGIVVLFVLFWAFFIRSLLVVREAPDLFSMFLSFGIVLSVMMYFLVNATYAVGLAPTTGLPMPFISYGGSHTIFTLFSMGILLNIARRSNTGSHTYYRGFSYE